MQIIFVRSIDKFHTLSHTHASHTHTSRASSYDQCLSQPYLIQPRGMAVASNSRPGDQERRHVYACRYVFCI